MKPGVSRGVSMGILGFVLGVLFVMVLRGLQSMDPLWDPTTTPGLIMVMSAFTITAGFMWGVGAFDPRMSEHGEHIGYTELAVRAENEEEEAVADFELHQNSLVRQINRFAAWLWNDFLPRPHLQQPPITSGFFLFNWIIYIVWFAWALLWWLVAFAIVGVVVVIGILISALDSIRIFITSFGGPMWGVTVASVVALVILFGFASAPTGLFVQTVSDPGASIIGNGIGQMNWPSLNGPGVLGMDGSTIQIAGEPAQVSQLTMLAIFVAITLISMAMVAGLIALVMYLLNRGVAEARAEDPTDEDLTPPAIAREFGGVFGWLARALRGIPAFLGYK